jgi:hypothetical protein
MCLADATGRGAGRDRRDGAGERREPGHTDGFIAAGRGVRRTGGIEMSFDLLAYADEHRCRVRNLHDGDPVPPTRRPRKRRRMVYRAADDRDEVIICRDGYVAPDDGAADRAAFCVLCRSPRALRARLRVRWIAWE